MGFDMSTLFGTSLADYGHPIFKRDGYKCVYCGYIGKSFQNWRQLCISRLRPKSAGGTRADYNLVTACHFCISAISRMEFDGALTDDEIMEQRQEYVSGRLKEFYHFWSGEVTDKDAVLPPEQGGAYLPHPLVLKLGTLELTDQQLLEISDANGILQIELTAKGELVIMPPTGYPGWERETELTVQVSIWAKQDGTGVVSGPSGGFRLPNGSLCAPDVSWVNRQRLEAWRKEQAEKPEENRGRFPGLCPDFVLELRSESDTLASVQRKMEEYLENGARLGWLIDDIQKRVHIYRPNQPPEVLENPEIVSGEAVLPGFELKVREIW